MSVEERKRMTLPYLSSILKCLNNGHISDLNSSLERLKDAKNKTATPASNAGHTFPLVTLSFTQKPPLKFVGLHSTGLPVYSKILLLAGFICSHNRPEYDRVLFDTSQVVKRRTVTPLSLTKTHET